MTFPRTKIQAPAARASYVERAGLEALVAAGLAQRRLTLLCAPAGYGKTALLAQAVARLPAGHGVAWVSADPGDDLQALLECLLAALEPFDPPWRRAPEALVHKVSGPAADQDAVAAELINTLEACELRHGVLVIDDLHRAEDPALFRFLDRLLERMGARWSLAITSRVEPPLALARLRAAGELVELRQLQLQLAREEARRIAAAAGLDEASADRVFDRTHGWPAGLRIAIGALQGGEPGVRHGADSREALERALRRGERPMFDFLAAEVLDQLRPDLTEFLLRVSVLPDLEPARCAAVSGRADSAALLDEIERMGLFVESLEGPERALRLHDLFRDALQQRLRLREPAWLAQSLRRAADSEPDPLRRIPLLLEAGGEDEAARLALEHVPRLLVMAGAAAAMHVLARFPATAREQRPELLVVRGLVAWMHWDFATMLDHFARAAAAFEVAGEPRPAMLARAYFANVLVGVGRFAEAEAALAAMDERAMPEDARIVALNVRAWLAIDSGRVRDVAPLLEDMVGRLERAGRVELWYQTSTPLRMPGLPSIVRPLRRHAALMMRAAGDTPTPLQPLAVLVEAWCAAWRGDLGEARRLRERAQAEAHWSGKTGAVHIHHLSLGAVIHAMAGEGAAALELAWTRLREQSPTLGAWGRYVLHWFVARIAAAVEDLPALREALQGMEAARTQLEAAGTPARSPLHVPLQAQLAWLEGRENEALAGWCEALEQADAIDVYGQASEVRVRLAAALAGREDFAQAARVLEPVFARAQEDGGPGGALLAPGPLKRLAAAAWKRHLDAARQASLRAWCPSAPAPASAAREALTAREMEVLERIAAGESNKAIARALDLSLHTVKRHVANILGKLDVATRGQAAAWVARRQPPGDSKKRLVSADKRG